MFSRLFKPRAATVAGRALYAVAAAAAREPGFYLAAEVPDTPEGRFELYVLHVVLVVRRLRGAGPRAAETSQAVFDAFVRGLDDGLREMGVGDLSVGKKMRKLGEAFYGRAKGYDAALTDPEPAAALHALIGRTIYGETPAARRAPVLARYVLACEAALARHDLVDLLGGRLTFPELQAAEPAA